MGMVRTPRVANECPVRVEARAETAVRYTASVRKSLAHGPRTRRGTPEGGPPVFVAKRRSGEITRGAFHRRKPGAGSIPSAVQLGMVCLLGQAPLLPTPGTPFDQGVPGGWLDDRMSSVASA
jgi:hypothetical protein